MEKKKYIYIYIYTRVFNHLEILELPKAAHIALEVCVYRLSNIGPHFINCIVDPQNYGPNWSLCRDIESSVTIELSVFVACLCRSFLFFCCDLFSGLVLGLCCDIL